MRMSLKSLPTPVAAEGAVPRVPHGVRLYAIGDIHGRVDLLQTLQHKIDADRAAHPDQKHVEIYLGDYVDRGADSAAVIDRLVDRQISHGALCLSGNHEDMMLNALDDRAAFHHWLTVGGYEAVLSYLNAPPEADEGKLQAQWRASIPPRHLEFLRTLGIYHVCGDYLFVHAGVRPGVPLPQQQRADMMWIRKLFLDHREPFEHYVIHGHQPVDEVDVRNNRMDIDTRAYESGHLTCVVLEGADRYFLST